MIRIYSDKANNVVWTIPWETKFVTASAMRRVNTIKIKVNTKSLEPYSSVFSQDELMDSKPFCLPALYKREIKQA